MQQTRTDDGARYSKVDTDSGSAKEVAAHEFGCLPTSSCFIAYREHERAGYSACITFGFRTCVVFKYLAMAKAYALPWPHYTSRVIACPSRAGGAFDCWIDGFSYCKECAMAENNKHAVQH